MIWCITQHWAGRLSIISPEFQGRSESKFCFNYKLWQDRYILILRAFFGLQTLDADRRGMRCTNISLSPELSTFWKKSWAPGFTSQDENLESILQWLYEFKAKLWDFVQEKSGNQSACSTVQVILRNYLRVPLTKSLQLCQECGSSGNVSRKQATSNPLEWRQRSQHQNDQELVSAQSKSSR